MVDCKFTILLLSETGGIGKTCFLLRYTENKFYKKHLSTIMDSRKKIIELKNGKSVKLQIFEPISQQRFRNLGKDYMKNSHGIILLYDITDLESFERLNDNSWINDVKENASKRAVVYLVGNKIDKEEERLVSYNEGEQLAKELNISFFESSGKENKNVKEPFYSLCEEIINKLIIYL